MQANSGDSQFLACTQRKTTGEEPARRYRVFRKNCVISHFTATPPSSTSLYEAFKILNAMRVYSHSYWLVIFCTTNNSRVLARERWLSFENSREKTQYLMNTLQKDK